MFDIHTVCGAAYAVTVVGDDFVFTDANATCLALTGMATAFHPGLRPQDVFAPSVADEIARRYKACVSRREVVSYLSSQVTAAGVRNWRTTLLPIADETGRITNIVGLCAPSDDEESGGTLSLDAKASLAIDTIDGGYWVYEVGEATFEASRSLAELLAGPGHMTLDLAEYISFVHSEDLGNVGMRNPDLDRSEVEYRVVTHEGRLLWLRSRRRTFRDALGVPTRVVGYVEDVTRQRNAFDALQIEASTDALTSIKNRRAFDRAAAEAFAESRGSCKPVGVLLIDLDGFKAINDRYGHRAGDEVLRKVARRIGRFVRKSDCFARLGGDEFAILLRGTSVALADPLVTRIRHAFTKPFMLGGHAMFVGISTGLGISYAKDQKISDVIDRADQALYAMKQRQELQSA